MPRPTTEEAQARHAALPEAMRVQNSGMILADHYRTELATLVTDPIVIAMYAGLAGVPTDQMEGHSFMLAANAEYRERVAKAGTIGNAHSLGGVPKALRALRDAKAEVFKCSRECGFHTTDPLAPHSCATAEERRQLAADANRLHAYQTDVLCVECGHFPEMAGSGCDCCSRAADLAAIENQK